jgi:phosphopantothenoylcysteine decarboxylase/phosphopantothenate--cysteine ligase
MTCQTLAGIQVVLAVTGSIAAVETVRLAHELRRRGAEVQGVMSHAAAGIILPDALAYATGRPVITRCTGLVEHVLYCGDSGSADLLLVAPCTANTLSKIACGIDDTPVTTFATTAIGRGMPVVIAPAMHWSMYRHPAVAENLERIRRFGIDVVPPRIEEGRAKIADIETIVLHAERAVSGQPLSGKRVLITSGACMEPVDDVRVLTTRSSGRMGRALALEAFRRGAAVTVVHRDEFPCVENVHAETAEEMRDAVMGRIEEIPPSFYLSAAAISDFAPRRLPGKTPSGRQVSLVLEPQPKLLEMVLDRAADIRTVAFKLGWDEEEKARAILDMGAELVVVDTPDAMGADAGSFVLLSKTDRQEIHGSKEEVAVVVWSALQ